MKTNRIYSGKKRRLLLVKTPARFVGRRCLLNQLSRLPAKCNMFSCFIR